jgi:NAD(P)-dependent dehydrogenase (short-subunit alcohol dehydrogenase family)
VPRRQSRPCRTPLSLLCSAARSPIGVSALPRRLEELSARLLALHPELKVLAVPVDLSGEDDVACALAQIPERAGPVDVVWRKCLGWGSGSGRAE